MLNRHFIDYINYGGYPEIVFSERMKQDPGQYIRHDIVDKVLLRDLPSLYGIQDTQELNRLFIYIAYHSGEEFSYETISKESEIKKEVLKKYLMYLEAAFLINIVYKVDANAKNMQRITAFKIYLTNPSLRCALFSPLTETDPAIGSMVETAIFAQWLQKRMSLIYYANWNKGPSPGEVDIVGIDIARQKADWAVEVKWSDRYFDKPTELKSLLYFIENNHLERALVTTLTKRGIKQLKTVHLEFVPAAIYAYTVGHNRFGK
jgi:predicted AAA+ superfamily ATPase